MFYPDSVSEFKHTHFKTKQAYFLFALKIYIDTIAFLEFLSFFHMCKYIEVLDRKMYIC